MKKILITAFLLGNAFIAIAQTNKDLSPSLQGNNEVKLNVLYAVLGSPEITYERIISNRNAIGLSVEYRLSEVVRQDFNYGIVPYFRRYFGARKASGFFLEGHASFHGYDGGKNATQEYLVPGYGSVLFTVEKETFFGLGAAAGAKFLTRKGFTGEIYLGAAVPFDNKVADFMPRAGLTIGKRF